MTFHKRCGRKPGICLPNPRQVLVEMTREDVPLPWRNQQGQGERTLQEHRGKRQQTSGNPGLDENLKLVAEHNLRRFLGCLYVETDKAQRQMYWNLLVQEQRWFAMGVERVEALDRLFRDCNDRVERQTSRIDTERTQGLDVTRNEVLLNNMLQTRAMLRDLLRNEMRCD